MLPHPPHPKISKSSNPHPLYILKVLRQGNSLMVTVPSKLATELGIDHTTYVMIRVDPDGHLIYTPLSGERLRMIRKQLQDDPNVL